MTSKLMLDVEMYMQRVANDNAKSIRNNMKLYNKIATGETYDSIQPTIVRGAEAIEAQVYANPSIIYINEGRKAGSKMPPRTPIEQWLNAKGIPLEFYFPIAKKIARDGIAPTPVIDNQLLKISEPAYISKLQNGLAKVILDAAANAIIKNKK